MPKLTVTVITKNEAADIAEALESAAWADEIVVVDSASADDTVAIARRYTDRVIEVAWPGYAAQKNRAAAEASYDWIFSLDADERVTPELRDAIARVRDAGPGADGYRVARRAWYVDRWGMPLGLPDSECWLSTRRRRGLRPLAIHTGRAGAPTHLRVRFGSGDESPLARGLSPGSRWDAQRATPRPSRRSPPSSVGRGAIPGPPTRGSSARRGPADPRPDAARQ